MPLQKDRCAANSTTEIEGILEAHEWKGCVLARRNASVNALRESGWVNEIHSVWFSLVKWRIIEEATKIAFETAYKSIATWPECLQLMKQDILNEYWRI